MEGKIKGRLGEKSNGRNRNKKRKGIERGKEDK